MTSTTAKAKAESLVASHVQVLQALEGQDLVFHILQQLGGRATITQLREVIRENYPGNCNYALCGDRLRKLERWCMVSRKLDKKTNTITWYIRDQNN